MTDEQLADFGDMDYDTGSRQSKSGYVRAVTNRYRTPYSDVQKGILETAYIQNWGFITIEKKRHLARQLGLTERQIKVWFQNRRARDRRENKRKVQEKRLFGDRSSSQGYDDIGDDEFDDDRAMVIDETVVEKDCEETSDLNDEGEEEMSPEYLTSPEKCRDISRPSSASSRSVTSPASLVQTKPKSLGKSSRKDYEPRKHQHIEGLAEAMNLKHRWEEATVRGSASHPSPVDFTSAGIKIKKERREEVEFPDYRNGFSHDSIGSAGLDSYHAELIRQMTLKNFYEHVSNWAHQNEMNVGVSGSKKTTKNAEHMLDEQLMRAAGFDFAKTMQLKTMMNNNVHFDILANFADLQPSINAIKDGSVQGTLSPKLTGLGARLPVSIEAPKPPAPRQSPKQLSERVILQPRSGLRASAPLSERENLSRCREPTEREKEAEMNADTAVPLDLSVKPKKSVSPPVHSHSDESNDAFSEAASRFAPVSTKRKRGDDEESGTNIGRNESKLVAFIWKGKCRIKGHTFDKN
ncbi:uncharacterized protein [Ptychodera flava]